MNEPASFRLLSAGILALALLVSPSRDLGAAEAPPADAPPDSAEPAPLPGPATNAESGIHLNQEAVEQLRREIEQSTIRNAEAINSSLSLIEPTLSRLHDRQMEAVQSSNRTILMVAGIFAAVGLLGLIVITLIVVRAIGRFSELAVLAGQRGSMLGTGGTMGALGSGSGEMLSGRFGAAEQASGRFQGAIEQLQKRILELEQSALTPVAPPHSHSTQRSGVEPTSALNIQPLLAEVHSVGTANGDSPAPSSRASLLLGKGQALLNLDAAEPALQCFDEVLALEPDNAEALVKKGMALEKLQDFEQALESYNRAIALDGSLTVAHLYRGGVCNRLQRYREALESYEQALRSEKRIRAS